jgi:hypothetical protein
MRCRVVWCGAAACEMKTAADTEQRSDSAAGVGAWAALVCAAGACSNARAHQRAQSPAPAAAPLTSHSCSVLVKAAVAGCASCRKPMPRPTSCKARGGGGVQGRCSVGGVQREHLQHARHAASAARARLGAVQRSCQRPQRAPHSPAAWLCRGCAST